MAGAILYIAEVDYPAEHSAPPPRKVERMVFACPRAAALTGAAAASLPGSLILKAKAVLQRGDAETENPHEGGFLQHTTQKSLLLCLVIESCMEKKVV